MGSPLGAAMANIFVGFQEELLFNSNIQLPLFYKRYVDDTFAIFSTRSECRRFFHRLNNLHPSLTFTCEFENNNCLPFLDVLVERSNNSILTSIYRKPTFTGSYTRWGSFCPPNAKLTLSKLLLTVPL